MTGERRAFVAGAVAGWAVIGWGVRGALRHHVDTRPPELARLLVGGVIAHDLVLVPLVLLLGWAVARLVRGRGRGPVQAALVVSGCLALFAYPLVRGYGRAARNPTSLPHDYTGNLLVVLAAVWAATAVAVLVRRRRLRR